MFDRHGNMQLTSANIIPESKYKEEEKDWEETIKVIHQSWYELHQASWKVEKETLKFKLNIQEKDCVLRKRIIDKRGKKSPWYGSYQVIKLDQHQRILIKKGRQGTWIHASQLKKYEPEKETSLEGKKGDVNIIHV
uniref:Transposase n=1 Tax=Strongyloides venezuelensis TaxID=75913 RepID=A0A0K0G4I1_STRVS